MSPLLNHTFFRFTIGFMLILLVGFLVAYGVGRMEEERQQSGGAHEAGAIGER